VAVCCAIRWSPAQNRFSQGAIDVRTDPTIVSVCGAVLMGKPVLGNPLLAPNRRGRRSPHEASPLPLSYGTPRRWTSLPRRAVVTNASLDDWLALAVITYVQALFPVHGLLRLLSMSEPPILEVERLWASALAET